MIRPLSSSPSLASCRTSKARIVARVHLVCSLLAILTAGAAFAQTGGEIIWSVDLAYTPATAAPRVAPDGTIYIHSDDLYAISPLGQIIWSTPSADPKAVDIGPDGTVYSGSGGAIFAYTPAGALKWSFTAPPGSQGIMAGPTVGTDGTADTNGNLIVRRNLSSSGCRRLFQALDLTTCAPSNVATP